MPTNPHSRAKIITSLNLKGGVGKTHLCWLIAGVCQEREKKCLVIDLDKQGNISMTLLGADDQLRGSEVFFNAAIDPQVGDLIRTTKFSQIDVIPGGFALERYNLTDPQVWKKSGLELSLVDPLDEVRTLYDYILLDCPADISLITYAALCASDYVMIPLEAAQWGALGTQHVVKTFEHVRQNHNDRLQLLGFVVSRFKQRRKYQSSYLQELRQNFGADAFKTVIPDYAPFEQFVNDRIPIVLHSPSSYAARIARRFFDEVEIRTETLRGVRLASGRGSLSERLPTVA